MNLNWLIDGPNLAFVLPLVLALVYLGLYIASGVTFGDPDVSGDFDGHPDIDADADVHADAHLDADADADGGDVDMDHDVQHAHTIIHDNGNHDGGGANPNATFNVLSWFGVGRVPISLWLSGAMLGWGACGIGAASIVHQRGIDGTLGVLIPFAVGIMGGLVTTRLLAVIVTRLVPMQETYAKRRHALLGSVGEAIFPIDASFGMVGIRDEHGDFFQVGCRADDAVSGATIAKGTRVKLVGYNRDTKLFHVVPANEAATSRSAVA